MSVVQSSRFPRSFRLLSVIGLVFSSVFPAARAEELVRYVSVSGADSADGLTAETAFLTLDAAYAELSELVSDEEPGVIRVLPGTVELTGTAHEINASLTYYALDLAHPITIEGFGGTREECTILSSGGTSRHHRHFNITNPSAVVRGVTLTGGSLTACTAKSSIRGTNATGAGSVEMNCGLVTNCFIHSNTGSRSGDVGAVKLNGNPTNPPRVSDCVISNNAAGGNGTYAHAVALQHGTSSTTQLAALLENSVIVNNKGGTGYNYSASSVHVSLAGGVVRGCVITGDDCGNSYNNSSYTDGGGVRLDAGLVERCIITNNRHRATGTIGVRRGAGVFMTGGLLHNNFISKNAARRHGGGVYASGGYIINNTIVDNTCAENQYAGLFITGNQVVALNNIVSLNQNDDENQPQRNVATSSASSCGKFFDYNCAQPETAFSESSFAAAKIGAHNISVLPGFVESGVDYRLSGASSCVDFALPTNSFVAAGFVTAAVFAQTPFILAEFSTDLTGVADARPIQGKSSSPEALPDLGCYEAMHYSQGPLVCSFAASIARAVIDLPAESRELGSDAAEGASPVAVTFSATISGSGTAGHEADGTFAYLWTVENSDGTSAEYETSEPSLAADFLFGVYDVTLVVSNKTDLTGASVASFTSPACLRVSAPWAYVSEDGANIPPYWRREDAARYISDAAGSLCPEIPLAGNRRHTVYVEPGTYKVRGLNISHVFDIDIRSEAGPEQTFIRAWGGDDPATGKAQDERRVIFVNHAGALLSGFTLTGGNIASTDSNTETTSGSVMLQKGIITNCIIAKNNGSSSIGGVFMTGGKIVDSVFRENATTYKWRQGIALYQTAGTVESCTFTNNGAKTGTTGTYYGTVVLAGTDAVLTNCVIKDNILNLVYDGCNGGGLYMEAGKAINCKIVGNYANRSDANLCGAGVFMGRAYSGGIGATSSNPLLRNCLIAGNYAPASAVGTRGLYLFGGTVENCTIANNTQGNTAGFGVYVRQANAFRNNIMFNNGVHNFAEAAEALFTTCCYPEATPEVGAGNISADPRLRADYTLRFSSPCRNTGTAADWHASATDLAGNPRAHLAVDIGAYEISAGGPTLLLLR